VLTIRKIRVASEKPSEAGRTAEYVLDGVRAVWLGSPRMLERLEVERGDNVTRDQLALALRGRSARSGERVRREGWIERPDGSRARGTKSVDLTFSAPKSVSVVWSQADADLRERMEAAMLASAEAMLECLTQTKPVVAHRGLLWPAVGFAAAAALHVVARSANGERAPSPQLHVHGVVVGVERDDGYFASPELLGLFKAGAPLEGAAVARVLLAERLAELGFEIEPETGRGNRFFEIRDVPAGLVERMSGRTRDVESRIGERELAKGDRLTSRERAVAALETRPPKRAEATPEQAAAVWRAHAADFHFDGAAVDALRRGRGFSGDLATRTTTVRTAMARRRNGRRSKLSTGEAHAMVLECAAGRLRLTEATALLQQETT
jgi:conjugative relaxase-like TrwC/TraI family protein